MNWTVVENETKSSALIRVVGVGSWRKRSKSYG